MEKTISINLLDLGSKARSKYEIYRLLTHEANLYLPPYKECAIEFITDYLEGKKKVLKTNQVTVKSIPQIKGLRAEDLYSFLVERYEARDFLPEIKCGRLPNRQWLSNLANSINPDDLQAFIQNAIQQRQEKILDKKCLIVMADEELAEAIDRSKWVSTVNGRSHFMLNTKKRDMFRLKKKMVKEWPEQRDHIEEMKREIKKLQEQLHDQEDKLADGHKNSAILADLYERGIIDQEGNLN